MAVSAVKPQLRSHGSPCFSPRQRSALTEADGHSSYCAELCLKRTWRQSPPPESQGKLALDPTAGTGPVYFSLYLFIFNSGGFFSSSGRLVTSAWTPAQPAAISLPRSISGRGSAPHFILPTGRQRLSQCFSRSTFLPVTWISCTSIIRKLLASQIHCWNDPGMVSSLWATCTLLQWEQTVSYVRLNSFLKWYSLPSTWLEYTIY